MNKINEDILFYDKVVKDVQNEIESKNKALVGIDAQKQSEEAKCVKSVGDIRELKFNFEKRKSLFSSKDTILKKEMRNTPEGRKNNKRLM